MRSRLTELWPNFGGQGGSKVSLSNQAHVLGEPLNFVNGILPSPEPFCEPISLKAASCFSGIGAPEIDRSIPRAEDHDARLRAPADEAAQLLRQYPADLPTVDRTDVPWASR